MPLSEKIRQETTPDAELCSSSDRYWAYTEWADEAAALEAECQRLRAQVTELQTANTREVLRRREAEAKAFDPTWPTEEGP